MSTVISIVVRLEQCVIRFLHWALSECMTHQLLEGIEGKAKGSIYKLDLNDHFDVGLLDRSHKVFHRVFWTFKHYYDAFDYCKPVTHIDGTHLYRKYRGMLLIATIVEDNNYVLPIAFIIVFEENLDNWSWFLTLIWIHVTQKHGICLNLIDIRESCLQSPNWTRMASTQAYHVFCLLHLGTNFNHKFKNMMLKKQVKKLGYTTSHLDFDAGLETFKEASP
ncbi:uncharacterized protein LOC133289119 [Gastrolobium bilobum]|uniref:uncharacterized protein LOC133289119 n=1 Tax=Gastrolobium bilobum TaxID=150636 RepID=UPI002AB09D7A|nr:uncharacterized protein LOC133289119 [Gastrolobium bilobum]